MKVRMRNAPFPARRSRLARGSAALCWRLALSAALLAGAQSVATAAEAPAAPRGEVDEVGAASDAAAVTRFIETFVADAVAILSDRALAPEARDEAFRAMLLAGFDTYGGARFVLGRGWRVATRDQRDEFVALFRAELLGKAKELFEGYEEGEVLEVVRVRRLDSGKFTVARGSTTSTSWCAAPAPACRSSTSGSKASACARPTGAKSSGRCSTAASSGCSACCARTRRSKGV
jgi:ABC-type transporter MlaC component